MIFAGNKTMLQMVEAMPKSHNWKNNSTTIFIAMLVCLTSLPAEARISPTAPCSAIDAIPTYAATIVLQQQSQQPDSWFVVPNWLAGTWRSSCETVIDAYDYTNRQNLAPRPVVIRADRMHTIGSQIDSAGNIWHCAETPYTRTVTGENFSEYQLVKDIKVLKRSANQLIVCLANQVTRFSRHRK